jgi:hypothetical protein
VQLSRAVASAWPAIASEAMQGEEEGASVALDTFSTTGTRDRLRGASPQVTESSESSTVGRAHHRATGDR